MTIEHVRVIDLTDDDLARCRELSFGDEGYMCEELDYILASEQKWQYRYSQAILIRENNGIVGWALLQPISYSRRYSLHLFVDEAHRRKGHGATLLNEANRWSKAPAVMVDPLNKSFFSNYPDLHSVLEHA